MSKPKKKKESFCFFCFDFELQNEIEWLPFIPNTPNACPSVFCACRVEREKQCCIVSEPSPSKQPPKPPVLVEERVTLWLRYVCEKESSPERNLPTTPPPQPPLPLVSTLPPSTPLPSTFKLSETTPTSPPPPDSQHVTNFSLFQTIWKESTLFLAT